MYLFPVVFTGELTGFYSGGVVISPDSLCGVVVFPVVRPGVCNPFVQLIRSTYYL